MALEPGGVKPRAPARDLLQVLNNSSDNTRQTRDDPIENTTVAVVSHRPYNLHQPTSLQRTDHLFVGQVHVSQLPAECFLSLITEWTYFKMMKSFSC